MNEPRFASEEINLGNAYRTAGRSTGDYGLFFLICEVKKTWHIDQRRGARFWRFPTY